MRQKLFVTLGVATLAAAAIAGSAWAGGGKGVSCPRTYEAAKASKFVDGDLVDRNGDGWICVKPTQGGNFNGIDNK